jgi:hypothetical protein
LLVHTKQEKYVNEHIRYSIICKAWDDKLLQYRFFPLYFYKEKYHLLFHSFTAYLMSMFYVPEILPSARIKVKSEKHSLLKEVEV